MTRAGHQRPLGTVHDQLVLDLPSRADEVAVARHAVAAFLAERSVSSVVVDDFELVTSELVTNAIIHPLGGPSAHVHVHAVVSEAVTISVSNVGPAAAIPPVDQWRPAPPLAISGRGLGIVRRLCDTVSVDQVGDRAVVTVRRLLPDRGASP